MAKSNHVSETPATHWLNQNKIQFQEFQYDYVDHGGAAEAARQIGIPLHQIAKTIIMQDDKGRPMIVLMHGDKEISVKNLARQLGVKKIEACTPTNAQRNSGYQVGGTSPFATRKKMPVYIQTSLLEYDLIFVNGGRRGYMIGVATNVFTDLLGAQEINAANILHASS